MHPGRYLGIVMGLVILVSVFALPFGSTPASPTLYGAAAPILGNLGAIQGSGDVTLVASSYLLLVSFILLVIAGVVGIFPLGTGVLGVVAMGLLTIGPSLIYPQGGGLFSLGGTGFYVLWAASIIALGAMFWHRREPQPGTA